MGTKPIDQPGADDRKPGQQSGHQFPMDQPGLRSGSKAGQSGSQGGDLDDGDADGVGAEIDEDSTP